MSRPRVLVLEDDPAVQRFIALALSDHHVELRACHTLAEARAALAGAPVPLLLMDLTLPDGSGLELLHWLRGAQAGRVPTGRVAVFSGSVDEAMQQQLRALGVWRVLHKPASVAVLLACVDEALDGDTVTQSGAAADLIANPVAVDMQAAGDPTMEFFAGNRALYQAYRATCLARFAQDAGQGDEALRTGDAQALRRIAHNLKSVLRMLGHAPLSLLAGQIEQAAADGDAAWQTQWPVLSAALQRLSSADAQALQPPR